MKCSETWLREWVNPKKTRESLCFDLTMGGLEVEELKPVAGDFSGIVVGQILSIQKHPEADRLNICEVDVGQAKKLKIVCGAQNVKEGMKAPVALVNAVMSNKTTIIPTTIRGVASEGMLCSASELGLTTDQEGLLELPANAPLGKDLREYLLLDDYTIDVSITPNRGDCLSVRGIARDVSALTKTQLQPIAIPSIKPSTNEKRDIHITAKEPCPHYVGRVIKNVKANMQTPIWLKEKLRRSDARSISPIVDVTNYVMLELGQPMHAFDLDKIDGPIQVRLSKSNEQITLLDKTEKVLNSETLVIADNKGPLAIAGVMGGMDSSVTADTQHIFLESAYFHPQAVAKSRQYYGLNSDSAYRFERGVDHTIQHEAIERATQLILEIVGGCAGPIVEETIKETLPQSKSILLEAEKVTQLLGVAIEAHEIDAIFAALHFQATKTQTGWSVVPPAYRTDMLLAVDLIEEIARLYGYDNIPTHALKGVLQVPTGGDTAQDYTDLRKALCDHGYHEIISYSFVDKKLQALLDPNETPREIVNPITADMTVMRTNMWAGLLNALLYNRSRQQERIRLFEIGTTFLNREKDILQEEKLGVVITGGVFPEQWGIPQRKADFYDLKGDIESILGTVFHVKDLVFEREAHPALHPGQAATIYHNNHKIGVIGAIHPRVIQELDLPPKVILLELDLKMLLKANPLRFQEFSKFPEIRRDIAILVNEAVPVKDIQDTIKSVAGDWLKDVFIFDVYQGKGISPDLKSMALALVIQHPTRTLIDDEVTELMGRVITTLKSQLGAELRS